MVKIRAVGRKPGSWDTDILRAPCALSFFFLEMIGSSVQKCLRQRAVTPSHNPSNTRPKYLKHSFVPVCSFHAIV